MKFALAALLFATVAAEGHKDGEMHEDLGWKHWWNKMSNEGVMTESQFNNGVTEAWKLKGSYEEQSEDMKKMMNAMFRMGSDNGEGMKEGQFKKLYEYFQIDPEHFGKTDDGYDLKKVYNNEDFNGDGFLSTLELVNAMIRADFKEEQWVDAFTRLDRHCSGFKEGTFEGGCTFEQYEAIFAEYAEEMKMEDGKQRMEIHMEEHPDGSSKMTIIMEGAKNLAVSAAAVATMALFAQ